MPQARLPDVNTAFIMYRREVLQSLNRREYKNCFGSLNAMNSLLPKEYRVQIDTEGFNAKIRTDIIAACSKCKHEHVYEDIKIYDLTLPFMESILTGLKSVKAWTCCKCRYTNKLTYTKMAKTVLQEPYYLTLVPSPPTRKTGVRDRNRYHNEVVDWVWTMIKEVEERLAQFRDDNWHKSSEMMDLDDDVDTSGDTLD